MDSNPLDRMSLGQIHQDHLMSQMTIKDLGEGAMMIGVVMDVGNGAEKTKEVINQVKMISNSPKGGYPPGGDPTPTGSSDGGGRGGNPQRGGYPPTVGAQAPMQTLKDITFLGTIKPKIPSFSVDVVKGGSAEVQGCRKLKSLFDIRRNFRTFATTTHYEPHVLGFRSTLDIVFYIYSVSQQMFSAYSRATTERGRGVISPDQVWERRDLPETQQAKWV